MDKLILNDTYMSDDETKEMMAPEDTKDCKFGTIGDATGGVKEIIYVCSDDEDKIDAKTTLIKSVIGRDITVKQITTVTRSPKQNEFAVPSAIMLKGRESRLNANNLKQVISDRNSKFITVNHHIDQWSSGAASIHTLASKCDASVNICKQANMADEKMSMVEVMQSIEQYGINKHLESCEPISRRDMQPFEYIMSTGKPVAGSTRLICKKKALTTKDNILSYTVTILFMIADVIIIRAVIITQIVYNFICDCCGAEYDDTRFTRFVASYLT